MSTKNTEISELIAHYGPIVSVAAACATFLLILISHYIDSSKQKRTCKACEKSWEELDCQVERLRILMKILEQDIVARERAFRDPIVQSSQKPASP